MIKRRGRSTAPILAAVLPAVLFSLIVGACGASDASNEPAGLTLARDKGCTSCHGADGSGGIGPSWKGIAGEPVELADGTTTTRDRDYLVRALVDPRADEVAGYTLAMPAVALTEAEVATLVEFLEELE